MMEARLRFRNSTADPLSSVSHAFSQHAVQIPPHRMLQGENMPCVRHLPHFIVYAWCNCKPTTRLSVQGRTMLVLSRKKDEKIIIGDNITVMVIEIRGDKVRLGIEAPKEVTVHRQEVYDAIKREHDEKRDCSVDAQN
jgi:carbon storage regulator